MELEAIVKAHAELIDAASKLLDSSGVSTAAIDQLNAAKRSFHAACAAAMQLLVRLSCIHSRCCPQLFLKRCPASVTAMSQLAHLS